MTSAEANPLRRRALRGGIPRDREWTNSPLQPLVVCSTVDQVGSSLLFRAYGTSEYGRSIRAGLTGNDALIILDEAHTSRAFTETLNDLNRYRTWAEDPIQMPFTGVEMSATPTGEAAFRESAADRVNDVLQQRWGASKRAQLVTVEALQGEEAAKGGFTGLAEGLAEEARKLRTQRGAKVIGVIANRVRTARMVHELLKGGEGSDAILSTGRSRPYYRHRSGKSGRGRLVWSVAKKPERPIYVVATQCIEVGANLNFDALATETASIDALEQRFGRSDRDGVTGQTDAAIVAQKDQVAKKYTDVLYGAAMAATWEWLKTRVTKVEREEVLPAEGKKKPKVRKFKEEYAEMGVLALRAALEVAENREEMRTPRVTHR